MPGVYDRVVDCTYCALADDEVNKIFKAVDTCARASGLATYDPHTHEGFWRHFVVRKGWYTGETMLIFSVNLPVDGDPTIHKNMCMFADDLRKQFSRTRETSQK